MPLTDTYLRTAPPKDKPYKKADGGGMFIEITPAGGKWWRIKYRFDGKQKLLSLGVYPDVGLKDARGRRDAARKLLANGVDPGAERKAVKAAHGVRAANSFEVVAREWFAKYEHTWVPAHARHIMQRLEQDVLPYIGAEPITSLNAAAVLQCLRRIEARGAVNTAHRVMQNCSQVFRYAIATGRAERDPTPDLRGAIPPAIGKHHAAITDPKTVAGLLRACDGYSGTHVVKCALRLAPLVFVRPGELRKAEWAEFDLDAAEWTIPAGRMKMRDPHLVPLATQAVAILRDLHPLTGGGRYVFPGTRGVNRAMSDNSVMAALRRMGFTKDEMTGHGFRAMARTILDEVLKVRPDIIEHQLAHAVRDPNGRAYNRTTYLDERRAMMQQWADYLDILKRGADVIPIKRNG